LIEKLIKNRRSIRKYQDKKIPSDILDQLIESARLAPTASNQQDLKLLVVDEPEKVQALANSADTQAFVQTAGAIIGIACHNDRPMKCGISKGIVDASIAMSFMVLQAEELGIGSCWLGSFDADAVSKYFELPDDHTVVCITAFGYADEAPNAKPRKSTEELLIKK
jgi:nitroreductase